MPDPQELTADKNDRIDEALFTGGACSAPAAAQGSERQAAYEALAPGAADPWQADVLRRAHPPCSEVRRHLFPLVHSLAIAYCTHCPCILRCRALWQGRG